MVNKVYKIDFWIRETPSGEIDSECLNKLQKKIEQVEGQTLEIIPPKNKKLAYKVKKIQEATWGEIIFQMPSEKLAKFLDSLKYDEEILRKIILEFRDYSKESNSKTSKRQLEKSTQEVLKKESEQLTEEGEFQAQEQKPHEPEANFDEKLEEILNLENLDN